MKRKICIIGSGSWGAALAIHIAKMGHNVKLWSFDQKEADLINNEHKCKFLPMAIMPKNIKCTTNIEEAVVGSDMILHVTPSKFTRETIKKYKQYVENQPVILCSKGFEAETLYTLDDVVREEMPDVKLGVLTGPSHAEEVSKGIPTTLVASSECMECAEKVQDLFMDKNFRIYTNDDIIGVEIGGAVKNIIALAAGVCDGIGYGDNSKAALMTRGMAEIARIGIKMGGKAETFFGLTGMGDLIVTCTSMHSRNRRAGILIGQGKTAEEAIEEVGMVVEGIKACKAFYELKEKEGVTMPITDIAYKVLFEGAKAENAVSLLMERDKKKEEI